MTDLKRAYARLIKTWKPDKFPGEFKKIRRAFEELEHAMDGNQEERLPCLAALVADKLKEPPPLLAKPEPPDSIWPETPEAAMEVFRQRPPCRVEEWLLLSAAEETLNGPLAAGLWLLDALVERRLESRLASRLEDCAGRLDREGARALARKLESLSDHEGHFVLFAGAWMKLADIDLQLILPSLDRCLHRPRGDHPAAERHFLRAFLWRHHGRLPRDWEDFQIDAARALIAAPQASEMLQPLMQLRACCSLLVELPQDGGLPGLLREAIRLHQQKDYQALPLVWQELRSRLLQHLASEAMLLPAGDVRVEILRDTVIDALASLPPSDEMPLADAACGQIYTEMLLDCGELLRPPRCVQPRWRHFPALTILAGLVAVGLCLAAHWWFSAILALWVAAWGVSQRRKQQLNLNWGVPGFLREHRRLCLEQLIACGLDPERGRACLDREVNQAMQQRLQEAADFTCLDLDLQVFSKWLLRKESRP